ncbi:MAG: HAD-IIIC family phosphatase [Sphingobacteriales bacterium]|nr:MAG: HAD-IIIC family phosphatase [Sphingobacteriales bacterium]
MQRKNYLELLKQSPSAMDESLKKVKIAILANHSIQQFARILKTTLRDERFEAQVYEAPYDSIAFETFDETSELYAFQPDYVYLSFAMQKYRERFLSCALPQEKEQLPSLMFDELKQIVEKLRSRDLKVILAVPPLPFERIFGNFGAVTNQSLYGSCLTFNYKILEFSRQNKLLINDLMFISNSVGNNNFLDERLWASSKYLCANKFLPDISYSLARVIAVDNGVITKCLVIDLDNTMWGGIIGDDGINGISLGGDAYGDSFLTFQKYILSLKKRGYILAVCSKNTHEIAMDAIVNHPEMILREADFAVIMANWTDKASNISHIASVLNIGLDSIVFIDDSPFERDLVKTALPMVHVPEMPEDSSLYVKALEDSGLFESTNFSEEDSSRNDMYRVEALRSTEKLQSNNIEEYLSSLEMKIEFKSFSEVDLPRIAQLIQRSNQFNLRTQRLSEIECSKYSKVEGKIGLSARFSDKFGDYGIISAVCLDRVEDFLMISELVMSCRVLKRGVEDCLINQIFGVCNLLGLEGVRGEYIPTSKNSLVKDFYKNFGFRRCESNEEIEIWHLSSAEFTNRPHLIEGI